MLSGTWLEPQKYPRPALTLSFIAWKTILFAIALLSPGPGYDTSTTLIGSHAESSLLPFVRWDAIYFTQLAQRGYIFEQEWAFSWALTRAMGFLANYLRALGVPPLQGETLAGIIIASVSHYLAVLVLFDLTLHLFRHILPPGKPEKLAFVSSCLHIISPAGLFLSAPYTESPFAMLQFLAYLLYSWSFEFHRGGALLGRDTALLLSGALLGLATAVRSNGILSGLFFAYDAFGEGMEILRGRLSLAVVRRLAVIIASGSLIAIGAALPQVIAYQEYCTVPNTESRPWCNALPPSIYTFVQSHYWNVGFLRYWTVSNIPLFLLAAPMLAIMTVSSAWAFKLFDESTGGPKSLSREADGKSASITAPKSPVSFLTLFAIPQALLVALTLTTSHVQIISRLSSGYPVWYWWVASALVGQDTLATDRMLLRPKTVIRWMVIYAIIQGGLYASFLPPA